MIKANDTPFLVSINQVQPIYATFTVPEQNLADIKHYSNQGKLRVQALFRTTRVARLAAGSVLSTTPWIRLPEPSS